VLLKNLNHYIAIVYFNSYNGIMNIENRTKINRLLSLIPSGIVITSSWLTEQGYSHELQKAYKKSQWFESIGSGAMVRTGENVGYEGALYAIQNQLNSSIHPGGRTALSILGKAHYLELGPSRIFLFGPTKDRMPKWFSQNDWNASFSIHSTDFLPPEIGLEDFEVKDFKIRISGQARAILECLYLAPMEHYFQECFELMEGLNNLRPQSVQSLLEQCSSVKVKRLFLYFAEKAGHSWLKHINVNKINLGKGKRSLVKNGVYIPAYQITVPREFETYDKAGI
jgi:hypothetical protein